MYQLHAEYRQIGCSDGRWCFKIKDDQPDWTVEGVDDTDHWSCVQRDVQLKYSGFLHLELVFVIKMLMKK